MSQQYRDESKLNIYHAGIKGNNSQIVFFDDEDRMKFLQSLFLATEHYEIHISAWSLMSNHVHLLLHGSSENLPSVFKSLCASYVSWHNNKHRRTGKMWEKRYHTRAVQSARDFPRTAAYIFNNPVRAGIVEVAEDYEWSNFREVCMGYDDEAISLMDEIASAQEIVSLTKQNAEEREDELDVFPKQKVTDEELMGIIQTYAPSAETASVTTLSEEEVNALMRDLFAAGGNPTQIARVTSISRRQVYKYTPDRA